MKRNHFILPLALISAAILAGCQTSGRPTAANPKTSIQCRVPSLAALPETKESQEKGGVEIAVVPSIYKSVRNDKIQIIPTQPSFVEQLALLGQNPGNRVFAERITAPRLEVQPERLRFTVRVNNKLARVFRGQGTLVQFNVAGKLIPFEQTDYKEFLNGIVPPRNEAELTILGPPLSLMPEKGTIGIFLYDVVTATDGAGNVTEKQSFEWYFDYSTKLVQEMAETSRVRGFVDAAALQNPTRFSR